MSHTGQGPCPHYRQRICGKMLDCADPMCPMAARDIHMEGRDTILVHVFHRRALPRRLLGMLDPVSTVSRMYLHRTMLDTLGATVWAWRPEGWIGAPPVDVAEPSYEELLCQQILIQYALARDCDPTLRTLHEARLVELDQLLEAAPRWQHL